MKAQQKFARDRREYNLFVISFSTGGGTQQLSPTKCKVLTLVRGITPVQQCS